MATHKDLLLLPGFHFEDIKGCIDRNTVGISLDSEDKLLKTRLGKLKNSLISEFNLNPVLDIDWEEYRDQFITEVREIVASKGQVRSHDLNSTSIMENDIAHIRRQPVPKFEIKIEGSNGAYSNLRLSIKNVSNVFVSGLKGISFYFLNKLGEPYTDVNNRPMPISEKFEFKETSIASGDQTTVKIDTPELYKQNNTINPMTGEKMRVSIVPHNVNVEFIFLCEDEYGEEYRFKAEATIPSASKIYSGVWKCKKID